MTFPHHRSLNGIIHDNYDAGIQDALSISTHVLPPDQTINKSFYCPSCVTAYWGPTERSTRREAFRTSCLHPSQTSRSRLVHPWQVEHSNPIRERRRRRGILSHTLPSIYLKMVHKPVCLLTRCDSPALTSHEIEDLFTGSQHKTGQSDHSRPSLDRKMMCKSQARIFKCAKLT